jgi:hypothetical protein
MTKVFIFRIKIFISQNNDRYETDGIPQVLRNRKHAKFSFVPVSICEKEELAKFHLISFR